MTAQEKAAELVDKFTQTNGNGFFAKECALITADEIIKVAYWPTARQYWQEVKQEIEKL
jgi:hypothetical protein